MTRKGEDRYSLADLSSNLSFNHYLTRKREEYLSCRSKFQSELQYDLTRKGEDRYSLVDLSSNLSFNYYLVPDTI